MPPTIVLLQRVFSSYKFSFCLTTSLVDQTLRDIKRDVITKIKTHLDLDSNTQVRLEIYMPTEPIFGEQLTVKTNNQLRERFTMVNDAYLQDKAIDFTTWSELPVGEGIFIVVFTVSTSRRSLGSTDERESNSNREDIAKMAQKRDCPSVGAKLDSLRRTQTASRPDAIYNCRPLSLQPPPITIYHPVFSKFVQLMMEPCENLELSCEELDYAFDFIVSSLAYYSDEADRQAAILGISHVDVDILRQTTIILGGQKHTLGGASMSICPVFSVKGRMAIKSFADIKNDVGTGGSDPISRTECAYVAVYSSDEYKPLREVSCCPAFLIGLAGPYITVAGAVFADTFISARLTDYIFVGPKATWANRSSLDEGIRRVAQLFRTLKTCFEDLDHYYSTLLPLNKAAKRGTHGIRSPVPLPLSFVPPHFTEYSAGNTTFKLTYTERLVPQHKEKAVFKAIATSATETKTVIIKFAPKYGYEGHRLLANAKPRPLAPELLFCENVESVGMYVIIMEFLQGRRIEFPIKDDDASALRRALEILHKEDIVFGDLREPNILRTDHGVVLLDFDWCGKVGEVCYPSDIFLDGDIPWHEGVCRGGKIEKEHDVYMLSCLEIFL